MRFRSSSIIFPLLAYFSLPLRLACFSLSLGLACVSLPLGASENVRAPSSGLVVMAAAQPDPKTPNTSETPAIVEADSLTGKPDGQIEATGNVILHKDGQTIRADRLTYSPQTQELDARGAVKLEQDGSTVSGPQLRLNLDTRIGNMEQPQFYLKENDARGSANIIHIRDQQHYLLEQATYTTCPADNDDWLLKMSTLEIDRDRQIGTARHNVYVALAGF